jgi:hypothetical protein
MTTIDLLKGFFRWYHRARAEVEDAIARKEKTLAV